MANKTAITLDFLKETYPGYRPIRVHEFQRNNREAWVRAIGRTELWQFKTIEKQIKAVIDTGAQKVCIFLRDPITEDALIPDIDIEKFIKKTDGKA